jgi:hypothetical protein
VTVDGARRAVLACGTTSIGLRTGTEQAAPPEGFGQWLNALDGGVQIVVSAARHDLTPHADAVLTAAERLPHPALRAADAGRLADPLTDAADDAADLAERVARGAARLFRVGIYVTVHGRTPGELATVAAGVRAAAAFPFSAPGPPAPAPGEPPARSTAVLYRRPCCTE